MKKSNFLVKITVFLKSLFYGLKSADNIITSPTDISDTSIIGITQEKEQKSVMSDFLKGIVSQDVIEIRDRYYRTYEEADNYNVSVTIDSDGGMRAVATKKDLSRISHPDNILLLEGDTPLVVQDNEKVEKDDEIDIEALVVGGGYNPYYYNTSLKIKRDGYLTKFEIEKFTRKTVIKENNGKRYIDLYVSMYPGQFTKLEAVLVANLEKLFVTKAKDCNFLKFDSLSFITRKAWGAKDLRLYEYNNIHYLSINKYDGNFVIHFLGDIVNEDFYIAEQFKTKEVDNKYKTHAPNQHSTDIFAIKRKIEKEEESKILDFSVTTLKNLEKE